MPVSECEVTCLGESAMALAFVGLPVSAVLGVFDL